MVKLNSETERLIADRVKEGGYKSADELVRAAIDTLDQLEVADVDPDTLAALEEAEAQFARGEGRSWEEVRSELLAKIAKQ